MTKLNYSKVVPGKGIGRYIGQDDKGDLIDEHVQHQVDIKDARSTLPRP